MNKVYDATQEFKPFERKAQASNRHPRPRIGSTRAKRERLMRARPEKVVASPPAKKKK